MGEEQPLSFGRLWYLPMSEGMHQYVEEDLSRLLFGKEQILLIYRSVFSFLCGMLVPCLGNPKKCLKH